jgi:hypothetical protein
LEAAITVDFVDFRNFMMRVIRFILSIALLFCFQIVCAESIMNKCTDGAAITYTDKPCEKLGLKGAGPIDYNVTITPGFSLPQASLDRINTKDVATDETPVFSVVDSDVYQCTEYYNIVFYSSSPCPKFSFVPRLGYNKPVVQQIIRLHSASEAYSGSSITCP